MADLQEYKCPCCGGAIAFDSATQKMLCPYCDTEFEVATLMAFDEDLKTDASDDLSWESSPGGEWTEGETDGMRMFVCKSCGGEIMADETTAATSCPFCGNPVVMMGRFSGKLKPDLVIPFKLDKDAARKGLLSHLQGKRLLPKVFMEESHIDEIKGVYVPFWLFDTEADASFRYKGTQTRLYSDARYNYIETNYFSIVRAGTLSFTGVPVDGSTKLSRELMESIEPFDLNEAVNFQTAYLAGYLADQYDVSSEQSVERANERIRISTTQSFNATVHGFEHVTPESSSIRLNAGKARYALLPVWLLNTSWNGHTYTFAMNGQTGKFVGDLPLDHAAANRWLWGLTAACTAGLFALSTLMWLL